MNHFVPVTVSVGFVVALTSTPAVAEQAQSGAPAPQLHVSDAHRSCFFDLHPELFVEGNGPDQTFVT